MFPVLWIIMTGLQWSNNPMKAFSRRCHNKDSHIFCKISAWEDFVVPSIYLATLKEDSAWEWIQPRGSGIKIDKSNSPWLHHWVLFKVIPEVTYLPCLSYFGLDILLLVIRRILTDMAINAISCPGYNLCIMLSWFSHVWLFVTPWTV